jgi:hypothetical protein
MATILKLAIKNIYPTGYSIRLFWTGWIEIWSSYMIKGGYFVHIHYLEMVLLLAKIKKKKFYETFFFMHL